MIVLCERCFPVRTEQEILTIVPLTACDVCGIYDDRFGPTKVAAHAYRNDPRNILPDVSM